MIRSSVLAVGVLLAVVPQQESQAPGPSGDGQKATEVVVYSLQHTVVKRIEPLVTHFVLHPDPLPVRIAADPRTNSFLLSGAERGIDMVKRLLSILDRETPAQATATRSLPEVKFIRLKHRKAEPVMDFLQQATTSFNQSCSQTGYRLPRPIVDRELNAVMVFGKPEEIAFVTAMVAGIDHPVPGESGK